MLRDYQHNLDVRGSIPASSELSGTTPVNGDSVQFEDHVGPVAGLFSLGTATGSPSSFSVECKLQESTTGSSNWTDITGAAVTLIANKAVALLQGTRTKPYVRAIATPAFTGGSTPKQFVACPVFAQAAQVP